MRHLCSVMRGSSTALGLGRCTHAHMGTHVHTWAHTRTHGHRHTCAHTHEHMGTCTHTAIATLDSTFEW